MITVDGDTLTFVGLAGGVVLQVAAKIVKFTGTTALNIVALW